MQRIDEIFVAINSLDADRRIALRTTIEDGFRLSLVSDNTWFDVHCGVLAGVLLKFACALSAESKEAGGKSTYNAPAWKALTDLVNEEVSKMSARIPDFFVPEHVAWQSIAQFATLASTSNGSRKLIYHKLILFCVFLSDARIFRNSYMTRSLGGEENRVIESTFSAVLSSIKMVKSDRDQVIISEHEASPTRQSIAAIADDSGAVNKASVETGVSVNFRLKAERVADLASFCDRFSFGDDCNVHAVIYRPRQSNPSVLIKSFLAIKSPADVGGIAKDSYVFTHISKPDLSTKNDRIASGKVLPLVDAVYFIGGQGPLLKVSGNEKSRLPFMSSKVIVVRWQDIVQHHPLFAGLALSMSGSGRVIASKVAVRITPIDYSDKISLREVSCDKIKIDLQADFKAEEEYLSEVISDGSASNRSNFKRNANHFIKVSTAEQIDDLARSILSFSNNAPGRGFKIQLSEKFFAEGGAELRASRLADKIDSATRDGSGPFTNSIGDEFDIWQHLRFGPLLIG